MRIGVNPGLATRLAYLPRRHPGCPIGEARNQVGKGHPRRGRTPEGGTGVARCHPRRGATWLALLVEDTCLWRALFAARGHKAGQNGLGDPY